MSWFDAVKNDVRLILAFSAMVTWLSFMVLLFFVTPAETMSKAVYGFKDVVNTIVTLLFGYYFGSSQGSDQKTKMLNERDAKG